MAVLSRLFLLPVRYPVLRGVLAYGTIWPASSIIQQTIAGKQIDSYDWMQALRFSIYGGMFVAPTLYGWVRLSSKLWPQTNLRTAITKALVEQVTYGPAALCSFFFGMSLLEGKSIQEAKDNVQKKFLPSYKVGVCVWPFVQTINFCFIPERNRVPFVSVCSLVWCCFLAYMHELQVREEEQRALYQNASEPMKI